MVLIKIKTEVFINCQYNFIKKCISIFKNKNYPIKIKPGKKRLQGQAVLIRAIGIILCNIKLTEFNCNVKFIASIPMKIIIKFLTVN